MAGTGSSNRNELIGHLLESLADVQCSIAPRRALRTIEAMERCSGFEIEATLLRIRAQSRAGEFAKPRDYLERLTARADLSPWQLAVAFRMSGIAALNMAQSERAVTAFETGLDIARDIGDPGLNAIILVFYGRSLVDTGRQDQGERSITEARQFFEHIDDSRSLAIALSHLASAYGSRGDYARAKETCARAVGIHRDIGNVVGEMLTLGNYSGYCSSAGDFEEAITTAHQALGMAKRFDNSMEIARDHLRLGWTIIIQLRSRAGTYEDVHPDDPDRITEALEYVNEAEKYFSQAGYDDSKFAIAACRILGLWFLGRHDEAKALAIESLAMYSAEELDMRAKRGAYETMLADVRTIAGHE